MRQSPQAEIWFVVLALVCGLGCWPLDVFARNLSTDLCIKEFMAINSSDLPLSHGELLDSDGESSDWIEIHNAGLEDVNLAGWFLTDDLERLDKWAFPALVLNSHEYLVVFASGKDQSEPGKELHASFKLSAKGESIAIVQPDGKLISDQITYDQQYANISFGQAQDVVTQTTHITWVGENTEARALIPGNAKPGSDWTHLNFNDSTWLNGTTGVGYDYGTLVNLDVRAMRYNTTSVYIRIPFEVADKAMINELTLRMKHDDGFVAFLNGQPVASAHAPDLSQLQWNASATTQNSDDQAVVFQDFDISQSIELIRTGHNVLAIHGLNVSLSSSDLLILPVLVGSRVETTPLAQSYRGYILEPTPGRRNTGSLAQIGPEITRVMHTPEQVQADDEITVTAQVTATLDPIDQVWLGVRLNYFAEDTLFPAGGIEMLDNGIGPDEMAGDNTYSAAIPKNLTLPGAMLRWVVRATDKKGQRSRNPLFPWEDNSPGYYGTVIQNPLITSNLPILHWYTEDKNAARSRSGTRASVFYDNEFYDNVFVRRRGGATVGSDSKKFVFNKGHKFRFSDQVDRVEEFNFNQNGSDASYVRQPLAFETHRVAGCPSSLCFLMMSAVNNEPDRVGIYVEQVDEEFLERNDLNTRGALYKFVQRSQITPVFSDITTGIEKKNRQHEDFSDIAAVVNAMNNSTAQQQELFVFDNFNLPSMVNYLAARCLLQDTDDIRKNFYFYCDTEGSGLWSIFPWDKDWTFGIIGDGGVYASHPFLGDTAHPKNNHRQWNLYFTAMYNMPRTREMYLRRLRTVMDQLLQSPDTPMNERFFENRVDELMGPALADLGNSTSAINALKSYFPKRRIQLNMDHSINNPQSSPPGGNVGIPNSQSQNSVLQFGQYEPEPESGNQDQEYIQIINPNNFAIDMSDWKLTEGIRHTFPKGTVICAGGSLYVCPDLEAFNNRLISPMRGQGLFVQGNYRGHLSDQGETVHLINAQGQIVGTLSYTH